MFTDIETQNNNTIQAAYLDLEVNGVSNNGGSPIGFPINISGITPGNSSSVLYTCKNLGDITGDLTITFANFNFAENGIVGQENVLGDTALQGELQDFIQVTVNQNGTPIFQDSWANFLTTLNGQPLVSLAPNVPTDIDFTFTLLDAAGVNVVQSDQITFDSEFKLQA